MSDLIKKSEYGKAIGLKVEMMRTKIDNCRNHFLAQSVMNDWESEIKGLYDALIILNDTPTVDAVEVVRCKDCKHWRMTVSTGTYGECMCDDMETNVLYTMADDYCSHGERKEVTE